MNKRPGLIAEGSSVDDDPETNHFEDDPTSDQLKRNKVSEDAASHSEDHQMGSEEEAGSSVQTANSNQDGTQRTSPEQDAASHSEDHPMGSEEEAGSSVQTANSNQDGTQKTSPEQDAASHSEDHPMGSEEEAGSSVQTANSSQDGTQRTSPEQDAASHSEDHPMGSEEEAGSSVQTANSSQDGTQRTSPEQDAASHSEDHPMGSEEEAGSSVQMANSNQDGTQKTSPEQMLISDDLLQQLQDVISDVSTYSLQDELLVPCFHESGISPEKLLDFFQKCEDLHKEHGKGSKNSDRPVFSSNKAKSSSSSARGLLTATVKVFSVVTGQTCRAHDAILENVRKSTVVEITSNQQDCDIIMIFCPIASRVGSDVEAAMRNIPADKPAILVLMHYTRDVDYSTDTKRWKEDYRNIELEVHVLFHETQQGLLKCKKNDQATHQIQKVLKSYSKRNMWGWS